jgi:hypothetical protein
MIVIGIDMSKNSPGVCIRRDSSLEFLSFIRGSNKGKITEHYKTLTDNGVQIHFYEYPQPSNMEYSESEVWKATDAQRYAEWITSHLPAEADFVGIEGFSYGSSGNSFIDIVGYGYAVRMALIQKYGAEKFSVFSPGNVKKTAGKGNANKEKIFEFFMNTDSEDLKSCDLWKKLSSGEIDKIKKPVDDLVDSYYVQECAKLFHLSK